MSEEKQVPLSDSGFRYGLGVFETVLVRDGVSLFHEAHWRNLLSAAKYLGLPVADAAILEKVPDGNGIWRWFLTSTGLNTMFEAGIEHVPPNYTLDLSPLRVSAQAWDSRFKTLSYLLHYQARHQTRYDEAVLTNERGEIATASMANIFWVKDGTLYTPDDVCGCRKGVVRNWVIENWKPELLLGRWPVDVLDEADEIFVTNSRIGIMPVILWRKQDFRMGPHTLALKKTYADYMDEKISQTSAKPAVSSIKPGATPPVGPENI